MEKKLIKKNNYVEELVAILRGNLEDTLLNKHLSDYHENDIAEAFTLLTPRERQSLYQKLGVHRVAEIFAYLEDAEQYMKELSLENAAKVVSHMDSDDAVDALEDMEEETKKEIVGRLDKDSMGDVTRLLSFDEDEIGSCMTNNYICILKNLTIRQAMSEMVKQAGECDNIMTIYTVDELENFYGVIDLKDLIVARENDELENIISRSYPYVLEHQRISDCLEHMKEYAEDSIPVLTDEGRIAGVITSDDLVELVDDALGDDYAKLAGLTAEEDLSETTIASMKKRLPWLIVLLFLGMAVSSVVGIFESVVAILPIVICFQSLVLDMAGNVGTQSLAVTIRVLMDENLNGKQKVFLVIKEVKIGFFNGILLGTLSFFFLGTYIHLFKQYSWSHSFLIAGCVGASLVVAMLVSSMVGTVIPLLLHKIKIDPAVASGPLITTMNDFVAVITYYGLAFVFLIQIFHINL